MKLKILIFCMLLNGWAIAQQENIVTNGARQYDNLQTAIDQANPGDTLILSGTFVGSFTIQKSLTLENANSILPTLDGNNGSRVLFIQGLKTSPIDVNLIGLVIKNGCASESGCATVDSYGGNGAGILAQYVNLNLSNSIVRECTASGSGGGIELLNCTAVIDASQIIYNLAPTGGGVFCLGSTCTIRNQTNIGSNKTTSSDGGGVVCNTSNLTIDNTMICYNDSIGNGGGLFNTTTSNILITNFSQIIYNFAGLEGGGIYNDPSSNPAIIPKLNNETEVSYDTPNNIYP